MLLLQRRDHRACAPSTWMTLPLTWARLTIPGQLRRPTRGNRDPSFREGRGYRQTRVFLVGLATDGFPPRCQRTGAEGRPGSGSQRSAHLPWKGPECLGLRGPRLTFNPAAVEAKAATDGQIHVNENGWAPRTRHVWMLALEFHVTFARHKHSSSFDSFQN